MPTTTRRKFLEEAPSGLAAGVALAYANRAWGGDANDEVVVGLVGCGGRGVYLAEHFAKVANVRVAWVCDADAKRLARAAKGFGSATAKATDDMRRMCDDPALDAVIVATPDHWHAPAAILACDAGKHVYVEKPCSHNLREGRLLVDAARRNDRVVQHGTQVRSTAMMSDAAQMLRDGLIGDVLVAKAWNVQRRRSIGHGKPEAAPKQLDYEAWVGPAPMIPYQANRVHDGWHWWYHFGTGDMGNDGVHDIDYARWGLGVETHPNRIVALGGKYFFDDDQEFPDTQQVTFEYLGDGKPGAKRMLVYEQRLWSKNHPHDVDSGVEYYGTEGQLFLSRRGKAELSGPGNRKLDPKLRLQPQDADSHIANFIEAVRGAAKPNAEIEVGHLTASLCHLGNLATRVGRSLHFDPQAEKILGDDQANAMLTRDYNHDHWSTPKGA